ncbi:DsbA family protein [Patescibacteria group bacterium]
MKSIRILFGTLLGVMVVVSLAGASCKRGATIDASSLVDSSAFIGNADAVVTIVEFSDYLCPACKVAHDVIGPVLDEYDPSEVRFVHKDFLIHGPELAIAARCVLAQDESLYWEYGNYLFNVQGQVTPDNILDKTKGLMADKDNFDYATFESCYQNQETKDAVMEDHDRGVDIGVNSTPTFIINNRVIKGAPREASQFRQVIDELLAL